MIKLNSVGLWLLIGAFLAALVILVPDLALAYEFEVRSRNLTDKLITTVFPVLSTLGLLYAAALAVTGDAGAKGRITGVVVCSIIGFLAPHFINWLKAAAGQ